MRCEMSGGEEERWLAIVQSRLRTMSEKQSKGDIYKNKHDYIEPAMRCEMSGGEVARDSTKHNNEIENYVRNRERGRYKNKHI